MRAVSVLALSLIAGVLGAPAISSRDEDWKTKLGWDGKSITPAELDPSNVVKPTPGKPAPAALPGGLFFTTDKNWGGNTAYVTGFNAYQCVNLGSDFNDKVTSVGPDSGLACMLYKDANCGGQSFGWIVSPGFPDLSQNGFNDVMSSFMCKIA